jgi:predicted ester cyclase
VRFLRGSGTCGSETRPQPRAFPNPTIAVEDQIAEGELVATGWTATMTHVGELFGREPTGQREPVSGITVDRFEDG